MTTQVPETIDDKITSLFDVISTQKMEVEAAERETKKPWKTNCSYHKDSGSNPINIQTASEQMITMILTEYLMLQDYYPKAAGILGSDATLPSGYDLADWIDDFKKRIAIINLRDKKAKLSDLENRLNKIVSPEQLRAMELAAITKLLTTE